MTCLSSCTLLVVVCAVASAPCQAQDVTLQDAIQCKEFKRDSDGTWYAEIASLNYGPGKGKQINFFDTKIEKGSAQAGEPDMWSLLNEKCGTGR